MATPLILSSIVFFKKYIMIYSIKSFLQIKEYLASLLTWITALLFFLISSYVQKPNCLSYNVLCLFKSVVRRASISFWIILIVLESSETGQQLLQMVRSSFVNIKITFGTFIKGTLSGLRQFLAAKSPLKMMNRLISNFIMSQPG